MIADKSYLKIRNFIGILGCLLPVLCLSGAYLSPNTVYPDWWTSISITYYSSPVLIAVLSSVGFLLVSYRGYNIWDTLVNTTAGICALSVVAFPTEASWLDKSTEVGLFWLPISITMWVHYVAASLLFLLLAINSIWLFSKSKDDTKNTIYKVCGYIILVFLIIFAINAIIIKNDGMVIVYETIMLMAFGLSWIVKGHMLDNWLK
ncbi:MAG: hypothetical protein MJZ13_10215 [Bacteroidales bacterium]|nr:hypothetical protein [Bacteroidales bacterium]